MNVHEYQAKALLARYNVRVPRGFPAFDADGAAGHARQLGSPVIVVKSQIHAGGRGKAGGVRVTRSPEEAAAAAREMLGRTLVTHQTGPGGREVRRLLIEEGCNISRELYLGMLVDRATGRVTVMVSTEGGMDIEEVAARTPERILRTGIDPVTGLQPFHLRRITGALGLDRKQSLAAGGFITALWEAFTGLDASIIEINPLAVTGDGELVALDAKIGFDDNALFRQAEVAGMRDPDEEDPLELEAAGHGLNYIRLDGSIGCMVNGAGLAMATMDIVRLHGGKPANFLDVGGGATQERVATAFRLILGDPNVRAILVNIFGGIMKCDVIAAGVIAAARETALLLPLVVRLEGTNVEAGKRLLMESGLAIIPADGLDDAARKAVAAAAGGAA